MARMTLAAYWTETSRYCWSRQSGLPTPMAPVAAATMCRRAVLAFTEVQAEEEEEEEGRAAWTAVVMVVEMRGLRRPGGWLAVGRGGGRWRRIGGRGKRTETGREEGFHDVAVQRLVGVELGVSAFEGLWGGGWLAGLSAGFESKKGRRKGKAVSAAKVKGSKKRGLSSPHQPHTGCRPHRPAASSARRETWAQ